MLISILVCAFTVALADSSANLNNNAPLEAIDAITAKEVCMKELGCFRITDDFKSLRYRPINVLPHDRVTINTKFLLYTKRNPKDSHQLVASHKSTLESSRFNISNPIVFIVHGFMDSEHYGPWMVKLKDEFLLKGPYNIIIVDWSGGNKPPYYQATANTRVVGAEIALMISTLEKHYGIKREDCYIIGHSLGSHIAGYAGARLKRLGRITGCDPAEPYFQNMPPTIRLDPTDANFVDVIHSDATDLLLVGLGMSQRVGHLDFFPNNGRNQPGCKTSKFTSFITEGLGEGGRRFAACNHQRSLDFYHYSISQRKVNPVGYECASWKEFLDGKCSDCGAATRKCAIMGLRAIEYKPLKTNTTQRTLYLQTSGKAPFWLYHYQVTIKLFKPKTSHKDVKGTLDITLSGSKLDILSTLVKTAIDLYHGTSYQYLVTTDKELGDIKSVSLTWSLSLLNPLDLIRKPDLYVESIIVQPMNQIEKSPKPTENRKFCHKKGKGIPSRTATSFLAKNC